RPISSMWPTIASVGPPATPATRACDEPTLSTPTSAAHCEQPSLHARAASVSLPDGPLASRIDRSSSGIAIARNPTGPPYNDGLWLGVFPYVLRPSGLAAKKAFAVLYPDS